jgi:hypothetical protein
VRRLALYVLFAAFAAGCGTVQDVPITSGFDAKAEVWTPQAPVALSSSDDDELIWRLDRIERRKIELANDAILHGSNREFQDLSRRLKRLGEELHGLLGERAKAEDRDPLDAKVAAKVRETEDALKLPAYGGEDYGWWRAVTGLK